VLRIPVSLLAVVLGLFGSALVPGERTTLVIDRAASRVVIDVGKSGVFGFAGHAHEVVAPAVRGTVEFDRANWQASTVRVEFEAAALKVTAKDEPPADVPEVQRVMLSDKVLDVRRFPAIVFQSRRLTVTAQTQDSANVSMDGELTLHGVTRPITLRGTVRLGADGALTARGSFSIKQTDFGIQPVTAGGGTVRVRDEVGVTFDLTARQVQ
jgi:polyisoprenoid-binding protein YceI